MGSASHKALRPSQMRGKGGRPASAPLKAHRRLQGRQASNVRQPPTQLAGRAPPPRSPLRNNSRAPVRRRLRRKRRLARLLIHRPRRRKPLPARRLTWRLQPLPKRRLVRNFNGLERRPVSAAHRPQPRRRRRPDSRCAPERRRPPSRARRRQQRPRRPPDSSSALEHRAPRRQPRHRLRPDNFRGLAQRQPRKTRRRLPWPTPICHRGSLRRRAHNSQGHRARLRHPGPRSCSSALEHRLRWPRMPRSIPGACRSISISCATSGNRSRWATRPSSARRTE